MTKQEIEERKAELKSKIAEAKTTEELEELRKDVEAINSEVPDEEPKAEEPAEEVKKQLKKNKKATTS